MEKIKHIAILSSSVRIGRLSHRIALFFKKYLEENHLATAEILDLKAYNFPLFDERLSYQKHPSNEVLDFTERFNRADGLIIVSPVYNASYPAALKNIIDLYFTEWRRKVVTVCSVTYGHVPGIATVQELQRLLLKLGAVVSPVCYTVTEAGTSFGEDGTPVIPEKIADRVYPMIEEFLWLIDKTHA